MTWAKSSQDSVPKIHYYTAVVQTHYCAYGQEWWTRGYLFKGVGNVEEGVCFSLSTICRLWNSAYPFLLRQAVGAEIVTASVDGKSVQSVGGLYTQVQHSLSDIDVHEFDLLLLPGGGTMGDMTRGNSIFETILTAYQLGIPIASICASATMLAKAGILNGRNFTKLVQLNRIHFHLHSTNSMWIKTMLLPIWNPIQHDRYSFWRKGMESTWVLGSIATRHI